MYYIRQTNEDIIVAKKKPKKKPKLRNRLAYDHPLMKKGGVHGNSDKAKRQQRKMTMKKELKQLLFSFLCNNKLRMLLTV